MLQLLFSLSLPLSVLSAGITVHTELGKRAMDLYDEHTYFETGVVRRILEDNQDAFQAGIPFPDFFYNPLCGDFGDVAEDAHWGPYLKVAVDYFRRTYPAPFEGNEERKMTLSDVYYGSYVSHSYVGVGSAARGGMSGHRPGGEVVYDPSGDPQGREEENFARGGGTKV